MLTYREWRKKYVRHWEGRLYVAYNDDGSSSPKEAVTVSEAIGWGMLIAVLARQHGDFRGFLMFYEQFLNQKGLMSWQLCRTSGPVYVNPENGGCNAATDGDLDAAYALFLAEREWPGEGYQQKALRTCAALWEHCINKHTFIPLLGDWVGGPGDRMGPLPDICYYDITRPSDFCLDHFLTFALEDEAHAKGWKLCLDACIEQLSRGLAPHATGLLPDFAIWHEPSKCYRPVRGQVLERPDDGKYGWNACRAPWRLATYYLHTRDARLEPLLHSQAAFFSTQLKLAAGYELSGSPLVSYGATSFLGPVWTLYQVLEDYAEARRIAGNIQQIIAGGWSNYYGDTILMMCQLQLLDPPYPRREPSARPPSARVLIRRDPTPALKDLSDPASSQ